MCAADQQGMSDNILKSCLVELGHNDLIHIVKSYN